MGVHTGSSPTGLSWLMISSVGRHIGSTSNLDQYRTRLRQVRRLTIALLGDTLDQHHTGLSMGGHTYWIIPF